MTMQTLHIQKNDAGQRLDKFLQKTYRRFPISMMYKFIRQKDIKRNGKRCTPADRLCEGDVLTLYVKDDFLTQAPPVYDFLSASRQLDILYEDDNLLLLNKKAGLLSHPDDHEYGEKLIGRVQRYLYEKGSYRPEDEQSFAPALVNRIDRNTCGIVIAARTAEALRILNQKLRDRELHKYYLCLVHGTPAPSKATLTAFLVKNESQNRVYVSDTPQPNARRIDTRYTVLESHDGLSLLVIELLTGRTHQIRAHLASVGHPLLGDGKYGTNALNKGTGFSKQALCSYKLTFDFTTDAGALSYLNGKSFQVDSVPFQKEYFS